MCEGPPWSPLVFVIILEVINMEMRVGLPCELLSADDSILTDKTDEERHEEAVNIGTRTRRQLLVIVPFCLAHSCVLIHRFM